MVPSLDGGDDFVGVGGPCEGLRVGVGLGDEAVDGGLEIDDGVEDKTRVAIEPSPNVRMLVGGIVIENDVDDLTGWRLRLDGVQKSNEFLMTMALHVAADDCAVEDVESGEQRRGAVPL